MQADNLENNSQSFARTIMLQILLYMPHRRKLIVALVFNDVISIAIGPTTSGFVYPPKVTIVHSSDCRHCRQQLCRNIYRPENIHDTDFYDTYISFKLWCLRHHSKQTLKVNEVSTFDGHNKALRV